MNPVFVILVFCAAVALWFLLAEWFPAIGGFFRDYWRAAKNNMTIDDKENEEENG